MLKQIRLITPPMVEMAYRLRRRDKLTWAEIGKRHEVTASAISQRVKEYCTRRGIQYPGRI